MNKALIQMNKLTAVLIVTGVFSINAVASDLSPSEQALQHYRCSALVELNRMTNADQKVCDKLKMSDFDLAAWESGNRDASIRLHEQVFAEFF